ncbi:response regulator [bacterium]|nr:response regulator [bacterium]
MSIRILLLEDDQDLRFVLAQLLEAEGYQVSVASRGQEAVQLAQQHPFDLVVADIRMEGLDGLDALAGVRELQPDVRALVVTGYSTEADSIRAIRLGVGDYLKKPFDLGDFLKAVARLAAERKRQESERERERTLLSTLRQALLGLARSLDLVSPQRGILNISQTALRLAQALELSPESSREVELACLLAAISETGIQSFDESELPAGVVRVLGGLQEAWDGSGGPQGLKGTEIPLESRVVAVALAAGRNQELDHRFDPSVLAALEQPVSQNPSTQPLAAQRRGLLSLGRALEAAGDLAGAEEAYRLTGRQGREGVEALLGLARLAQRQGQMELVAQLSHRARELSHQVGPLVTATTLLETGILQKGPPDLFRQAGRLFQSMRVAAGEARALLGLASLGEEIPASQIDQAAQVLLAPEQSAELAASAPWLFPFVMGRVGQGQAGMDRLATRLVREFPRELQRQLTAGQLSQAGRIFAAQQVGSEDSAIARLLSNDSEPAVRAALHPNQNTPTLPALRIHSLGALEVYRGDEPVDEAAWRGQKTKHLLAYLAAQAGRPVSEEVIIDQFWPDELEKGRRSLYWASSVLRRCLRPSLAPENLDYLPRSGGSLRLNPELPRWHDLDELQQRAAEALRYTQQNRSDLALDCHRRVLSLYRGPYLESCYMDWSLRLRSQCEEHFLNALTALTESAQSPLEALEYSQRMLEIDACRQEAALAAMNALVALGRPEEAVRRYEACCRALRKELGMEPAIPLMEAYHRAKLSL